MSEFSESYHLLADRHAAAALLERAGLAGWVLGTAPVGWTTLVVDRDFTGSPDAALVDANEGLLLHYVNAEDHGWSLQAWQARQPICRYQAEWDFDVQVDVSDLSIDALRDAVGAAAGVDWPALEALLVEDVDEDDLLQPGANPGHRSAAALGLGEGAGGVEWLSGAYLRDDGGERPGGPDPIRVGGAPAGASRGRSGAAGPRPSDGVTEDALVCVARLADEVVRSDHIPGVPLPPTATWAMAASHGDPVLHVGVATFDHDDVDRARRELEAALTAAGFTTARPDVGATLQGLDLSPDLVAQLGAIENIEFDGPGGVGIAQLAPTGSGVAAEIQFSPSTGT